MAASEYFFWEIEKECIGFCFKGGDLELFIVDRYRDQ